ncbi:type II toxin-antitoxin system PemK/MazF family toxin [Micromonospora okii]|uniref:type II toxin-antitoxin system PemK/MazF family toxin n=1 Tax=Micromonospora okii TaxID=1182970 RepID=UPI001E4F9949|nr:type II toxin-antitoxin system PemK/MazF family toxin [Micromonospora okii]
MPDWLLWAAAILLAVAAGWAWSEWRGRSHDPERPGPRRPRTGRGGTGPQRPRTDRTPDRPDRASDRPGRDRPGRARPGRPTTGAPGRPTATPRPRGAEPTTTPTGTPRPGEIWWADVPYADGTGSKVRPCLVLRVDDRGVDVLKITSRDKSDRDDHVRIPTRDWDPTADHDSYLDIAEPIPIPLAALDNRAGDLAPHLWRHLRTLPHLSG